MADNEKSKGLWHTLPGIMTAIAGIITAVAGLLVALYQINNVDREVDGKKNE